jgi:hypothetical protein
MDKLIKTLAPFGVMGTVFIMALTDIVTVGLSGMIGGAVTLTVVGLGSKLAVDYGYDAIAMETVKKQLKTKSKEAVWNEISKKKLISKDLKLKVKDYIDRA